MFECLAEKTTFIVGSEKNAGKTTFLNYALARLRQQGVAPAFLTIGIDGEQQDHIFGHPKPLVYSEAGDFLVTTESMLDNSSGLFEIHEVLPVRTVLGRVVVLKTLRGGSIELVGPEENRQLSKLVSYLRLEKQARTILVDGAVNRITQVASGEHAGFIYVLKVTPRNLNRAIEKIRLLSLVKEFPQLASGEASLENDRREPARTSPESFRLTGALTTNKLTQIPKSCNTLILEDFTKIFLSYTEVSALREKMEIVFETTYQLHGIVVNLYDVARHDFMKQVEKYGMTENLVFNPYQF